MHAFARVTVCVCVGGGGGVGAIKQGGGAIKRGGGGASAPNAPPMGTPLHIHSHYWSTFTVIIGPHSQSLLVHIHSHYWSTFEIFLTSLVVVLQHGST